MTAAEVHKNLNFFQLLFQSRNVMLEQTGPRKSLKQADKFSGSSLQTPFYLSVETRKKKKTLIRTFNVYETQTLSSPVSLLFAFSDLQLFEKTIQVRDNSRKLGFSFEITVCWLKKPPCTASLRCKEQADTPLWLKYVSYLWPPILIPLTSPYWSRTQQLG